jgi:putative GTP pyrophosphokinase
MPKSKSVKSTSRNDFNQTVDEYTRLRPLYVQYVGKLESLLGDILSSKGINYQSIEVRAKTIESFSNKISSKGMIYKNPIKDIFDLAGLRIILFYQEDVNKVCSILRSEFKCDLVRSLDKRTELAFDQFGYISVHMICRLSADRRKLLEWAAFKEMVCEIQVRTVLQHAWASISHALQYKRENDIPLIYRRKLVRLSGLLELADEEFSELKREQLDLADAIDEQILKSDLNEIKIDSVSISRYLAKSKLVQAILKEVYSHEGFEPSNSPLSDSDQLIRVSHELKISSIDALNKKLSKAKKKAKQFYDSFALTLPKASCMGNADHWCAVLLVSDNLDKFTNSKLKKMELWGEEYIDWIRKSITSIS